MYSTKKWVDEVRDHSGQIIQKGTPLSSKNMNNLEQGINESNILANEMAVQVGQLKRDIKEIEGEIGLINLSNANKYPFNNSLKTIAIKKPKNNMDYRIELELVESDGPVENIRIRDKQLNGFKIEFSGSAKNVTVKYYIQGGLQK